MKKKGKVPMSQDENNIFQQIQILNKQMEAEKEALSRNRK